jgi:uncharacterized membrane protein YdbT with pleckstrin-like domain
VTVALSAGIFWYAETTGPEEVGALGILCVFVAILIWLQIWITRVTTEIAVTDRRVIVKRGLVRRSTMEMNVWQVESVGVDQSILGRLLDYGTVTARGTGAGIEPIAKIAEPLRLREAINRRAQHGSRIARRFQHGDLE